MLFDNSGRLFETAKKYIPGGVNSPVRAFRSVGMNPLFIARGSGSKIYDVDGNEFIDYVGSWGPLILGHANPRIITALKEAINNGTSYGAPTELEITLAEMVVEAVPSIEEVRMVSSGTEATMSAIRVARGFTGREKIIKFEGCYHGHADSLLVKAGSGVTTLGLPDSPGVTKGAAMDTINLPYNDVAALESELEANGASIACVIIEGVAGNMGVVPPTIEFLSRLRELTDKHGIILIFDEVMSGFRVAYGGAQEVYRIIPDMTCLGKVIGGGLPVGAFGGKKEIMEIVAPAGKVYQAGTLSGNPLAMTAGIETLKILKEPGTYEYLDSASKKLAKGLGEAAREAGVSIFQTRVGSMQCAFFTEGEVVDYATAKTSDTNKYSVFFRSMLEQGVYLAPSQFEACFVSTAHDDADIERTLEAARIAMRTVQDVSL